MCSPTLYFDWWVSHDDSRGDSCAFTCEIDRLGMGMNRTLTSPTLKLSNNLSSF